jgi:cytosine/uracil/thiamine/allantoin permease
MLLIVVAGPLRRRSREAWTACAISVAAWFIADMAFSLTTGFWQNAVLNVVLAILFAVPLAGIHDACERRPERLA